MGILYNKGIIKDRGSIKESNDVISLRKKFKSEDSIERQKILEKFADTCGFDICIAFVDISFYLADFNLFEGKQRKHFCISANNHSG